MLIVSNKKGFTLLELIVAIAIMGLITAFAAPNFLELLQNREMRSQAAAISEVMSSARSTALSKAGAVEVCWNNTASADTFGGPNVNLQPGQMVMIDTSVADNVGRLFEYQSTNFFIDDSVAAADEPCVVFGAQGRANITPGFLVCRRQGDDSRAVTVSVLNSGRSTVVEGNTRGLSCD